MNGRIEKLELRREILHILIGIAALLLILFKIINPLIIFIILCIAIVLSLISLKINVPIISWFLDNFEREKDKNQLPGRGFLFAVAGTLLALQLFPQNIALASIIILIFADPTSHIVGKLFGKTNHFFDKKKNIEGHLSGFIVSSILASFFVPIALAIAGSLTAMLFESIIIEIQKIQLDDNLMIPLTAGTVMFLIIRFLI